MEGRRAKIVGEAVGEKGIQGQRRLGEEVGDEERTGEDIEDGRGEEGMEKEKEGEEREWNG